jgi:uncharacterized protein YegP (UPF0339 family)
MRTSFFAAAVALLVSAALPACAIDASQAEGDEQLAETDDELTLTSGKFETFTGADGKLYFHLLAGNGEKVLASEGYASGAAAANAISLIQTGAVYELRTAKSGESYFVAKAANGAVLGTSELYASESNARRGIETVRKIVARTSSVLAAPSGAQFQVIRGLDKAYYFHLRAHNGEIVLQSQGYASRTGAMNGVASVRTNGADSTKFQLLEASNGQWYFVLKATNGAVIARGETYASRSNAQRAVQGVVGLLAAK